jgi:CMP-N,N'-diacetyllegionaminic acid synthase
MVKSNVKVLGIVGIRSGSKGVDNKNIRNLSGRPLVGWVLSAALQSNNITRLVVSTDSEAYALIAKDLGAEVPCLRPIELAEDDSLEFDYVHHMLEWLRVHEGYCPDIVVRMMSTVPLQTPDDIDAVVRLLDADPLADSAVVIAEARQQPMKALKIVDDGFGGTKLVTYLTDSSREVTPIGRQSYQKAYFRANIIAFRTRVLYETKSLTGDLVRYHIIPQERAVDIDSLIDFDIAEYLMAKDEKLKL